MAVTTPPPAPMPGAPLAPFGQDREPPRASWWSLLSVFATLILAGVVLLSIETGDDADELARVVTASLVGLGAGALLSMLTPVGQAFRKYSAIPLACIAGLIVLFGVASLRGAGLGEGGALVIVAGLCAIAALDLCFVSRLRVMVVLSGFVMVMVVAALDSSALFSAFAWFTAAMFSLWLLSVDEQRSLPRPEPIGGAGGAPRARGADLVRTIAMALLIGFTLAFLMSTPSCSFSPLARMLEWLPWHPEIQPRYVPSNGQPVRLIELDDDGHEFVTYLDPEGRRFLADPISARPYAVVDREGRTSVLDSDGREVAHFDDGDIVVTGPTGDEARYERDDEGWYLDVDGDRYRVRSRNGSTELIAGDGSTAARSSPGRDGEVQIGDGRFSRFDGDGDSWVPVPNDAVLDGTTGTGHRSNDVIRADDSITVRDDDGERRVHRPGDDGGSDVQVLPGFDGGATHSYHIDSDGERVTVYDDRGDRVLELDVDREGNAFDGIEGDRVDIDEQQPDTGGDRPSPPWRTIAIVVAVVAAIGAGIAVYVWWRRKQTDEQHEDRDWAEAQVRRLEGWGRDHTFPRERAESVVRYGARLDHEIARDRSLLEVADVLDDGLFGKRPLSAEARMRTEATIDRLIEEHPKPGRAERLRGGPDHGEDREPVSSDSR